MKINFIFVLIVLIRESVGNNVFVDLKSNYISDGITVHHGRFSVNGKYMMYIGKSRGIEAVIYGTGVLYRTAECPVGEQVVVEMFEDIIVKYFIIHVYTGTVLNHTRVKRKYYAHSDWGYKKVDQNTFMTQMTSEIELMFDVATKIRHPYMIQTVESKNYYTETYSLIDQVGGVKLDGIEAPKYTYGIVYDSSMMIKMGYSSLDWFVSKCEKFSIEYNLLGNKITFEIPLTILEYRVTNLMNKLVWDAQIKDYKEAVQKDHVEALKVQAMFDGKPEAYEPIILDISEQVAPELFGIEKVTGVLGNGDYTLYQMKKEYVNHYRIKTIVDTGCEYKELFEMDETFIFSTVEVFSNRYRKIVVINSMVKDGDSLVRRQDMLKKMKGEQLYYRRVAGMTRSMVYSGLEKNFPIRINLLLHEKENAVYDSTETTRDNENYTMYNIKESDGRGMRYVFKYIFGDILERTRYRVGNVPEEPCTKGYYVLKKNVYQTQVIVARSEANMEKKEYIVYNIL